MAPIFGPPCMCVDRVAAADVETRYSWVSWRRRSLLYVRCTGHDQQLSTNGNVTSLTSHYNSLNVTFSHNWTSDIKNPLRHHFRGLVQKRTSREHENGLTLTLTLETILARCASGLDPHFSAIPLMQTLLLVNDVSRTLYSEYSEPVADPGICNGGGGLPSPDLPFPVLLPLRSRPLNPESGSTVCCTCIINSKGAEPSLKGEAAPWSAYCWIRPCSEQYIWQIW